MMASVLDLAALPDTPLERSTFAECRAITGKDESSWVHIVVHELPTAQTSDQGAYNTCSVLHSAAATSQG
jgi:hypothetical protein